VNAVTPAQVILRWQLQAGIVPRVVADGKDLSTAVRPAG
jgi:diketogulonate reductase-like aldo/keto reductase